MENEELQKLWNEKWGPEVFDIPLLETDLPDDDVTDQLIKHGYYKRK